MIGPKMGAKALYRTVSLKLDLISGGRPVERAKSDTEAFGELYDRYYSQIFGFVLRRTASIEAAQDV
ncbi:MAG: hypothetical protein DRI01_07645, partial [Chloroflexi bacterium]